MYMLFPRVTAAVSSLTHHSHGTTVSRRGSGRGRFGLDHLGLAVWFLLLDLLKLERVVRDAVGFLSNR